MTKPLLSIIVPVYNVAPYLSKCINNILGQTLTEFELILVNNGSTDNSLEILEDYSKKDSRIIVLDIEGKGVGLARNAGLKIAVGKYVGFLDADDWVDNQMFECLIRNIEEYSAELSCCKVTVVENGVPKEPSSIEIPRIMSNKDFIMHTYDRPGTVLVSVCNKIFIRALILELFDENLKCDEDALFLIHYCMHIKKVAYTDEASYYYNRRQGSSTMSNLKIYAYGLTVRRQLCEELFDFSYSAHQIAEKHFLDRCCFSLSVSKNEKESVEYNIAKTEFTGYLNKNFWIIIKNSNISWKQKCVIAYWMIRCFL